MSGDRLSVAVNLLWMVHGEVGGSETYTLSHLEALAGGRPGEMAGEAAGAVVSDEAGDVDLTLFALPGFGARHPDLAAAVPVVEAPIGGGFRPGRVALEASWLAARTADAGFDVVHHPGGTVPLRRTDPCVVTIHDLQWVTFPEHFSRTKLAYLRAWVARSARAAAVVVVNSEYVKGTVVDHAGVAPHRIAVAPPAIAPPIAVPGDDAVAEVRHRYALDRPWFLFPAITYPHKNHRVLVEALARLGDDALLVLTGGPAGSEHEIRSHADQLGVAGRVRRLGRVPQADLEALYRGATAVVFPSRYEGFGMGVGEAMVRGCPVVAAATTALPEVVGDAGLLLDPDDADAWCGAMRHLLDDPGLRDRLVGAGHRRVARFSPERAAAALRGAYRDAAALG